MNDTRLDSTKRLVVFPFLLSVAALMWLTANAGVADEQSRINLAIVAEPSTSYVSGDTRLSNLNDGDLPQRSMAPPPRAYGNWPRRGTQWVQYEWSKPISTREVAVYWWDDHRGVRLPSGCRLLHWDENAFQPVPNASGLGVAPDRFNITTFDEITTTKLRLEIISQEQFSTGLLEWQVFDSGKSPAFAPRVDAGVDRVVVLGGKTYLNGSVKSTAKDPPTVTVRWSKSKGPGAVTFDDATSLETTAAFSQTGQYELRLAAAQQDLESTATVSVKVIPAAKPPHLEPLTRTRWRCDHPLWSPRLKAVITQWIPHCVDRINDPDSPQGGINNFVEASKKLAGKPHEAHRGYVFSNAWVFNMVEAMCDALMLDAQDDEEIVQAQTAIRHTLDDWIPKILSAQEPDGYLQTAFTLNGWERWSPSRRSAHEGYIAGYFIEAGIAHYQATAGKDDRLYRAARKLADCWYKHIGPPPKQAWYDGHQGLEMALVRLGRFVNHQEGAPAGDKYIELAKFLLDCRGNGHAYDQSHLPVTQQYEAVGHAVRAVYNYAAMAQIARHTGDLDYQSATMSLWDNIVHRKYYVTGGVGSGETSEGFGPDYSLRHNAYCESCSSCGEIFFQHELMMMHGEARFADLYEETLYNALLGSLDLAGKNFYYQNPLDCRGPRYPWHGCPCCVGNIPRTLLRLPAWTYSKLPEDIYLNLFIGSTVTIDGVAGTDVQLTQKTDYPWDGGVTILIDPDQAATFALHIRSPQRSVSNLYEGSPNCDGIRSITVNGRKVDATFLKGYAVIRRTWQPGDRVEIELPMAIQRIRGNDRIEATRGQVALRYGPLIYAFESVDQELDHALPVESPLTTRRRSDLLGGILTIEGRWSDGSPMVAIPYYARANRIPTDSDGKPQPLRAVVWVQEASAP